MMWLLSAPQFWYVFVACATLVFLALLPGVLFPRRTVLVHSQEDRAPVPPSDPFYKPGAEPRYRSGTGSALREHRRKLNEERPSYDTKLPSQSPHTREARRQVVWHPHPDDCLPSWGVW